MRRDDIDFHTIKAGHELIHARLLNWARWSRSSPTSASCQPMFRGYRPYAFPEAKGGGVPVDTLDAVALQKLMAHIPEKNRWAVQWSYSYPFISPFKVCRHLGVTKVGLIELVTDARTMLRNRSERGLQVPAHSL